MSYPACLAATLLVHSQIDNSACNHSCCGAWLQLPLQHGSADRHFIGTQSAKHHNPHPPDLLDLRPLADSGCAEGTGGGRPQGGQRSIYLLATKVKNTRRMVSSLGPAALLGLAPAASGPCPSCCPCCWPSPAADASTCCCVAAAAACCDARRACAAGTI